MKAKAGQLPLNKGAHAHLNRGERDEKMRQRGKIQICNGEFIFMRFIAGFSIQAYRKKAKKAQKRK